MLLQKNSPAYPSPWVKQGLTVKCPQATELILHTEAGGGEVGKTEECILAVQAYLYYHSCMTFLYKEYQARRGHLLHQVGSIPAADSHISIFILKHLVFLFYSI